MKNVEVHRPKGTQWMTCALDSDEDSGRNRTLRMGLVFVGLITVAMVGVLVRVVLIQSHPPTQIARRIDSQYSRTTLQPRRGSLLDRRGRILATTRLAQRLFVDPALIENPNTFSEEVGYRLGYDPAWVEKKVSGSLSRRYVVIDHRLNDRRHAALRRFRLAGLASQSYPVRDYPHGALAAHVIGFVGVDGVGLEGLERSLNNPLGGKPGALGYLRDAFAKPLWVERPEYKPPVDGRAVSLSLDVVIQAIAETQLRETCERFSAPEGQLIVMDPYTGEILAMANYPAFDAGRLAQSKPDDWRNRCVTDVFEPGSTFKPFVWAAAIEAGLATPELTIDCTDVGVYRTSKGRRIRDVHAHGRIAWDDVLVKSSNIGMAIVGQQMSPTQMYRAVRAFGFGSVTGSRLPGEVSGLVTPFEKWNHYTLTSVPMGQEIAVTALQLVTAFGVISNGGYLVRPTILAVRPSSSPTPIYERVLEQATAVHTRHVLRRVVTEGTGHRANSGLYGIFGKTGTAQIADPVNGGYLADQYVSSFVGGAPFDEPRVIVICAVHRSDVSKGYHGGTVAAPAVRRVIEETMVYLGVRPRRESQEPDPMRLVMNR